MIPVQLKDLKLRSKCRQCQQFGHWGSDHNPDGTLKAGTPSASSPIDKKSGSNSKTNNHNANNDTLHFGYANVTSSDVNDIV